MRAFGIPLLIFTALLATTASAQPAPSQDKPRQEVKDLLDQAWVRGLPFDQRLQKLEQALAQATTLNDYVGEAQSGWALGECYLRIKPATSRDYFLHALDAASKVSDDKLTATIQSDLALVYANLQEPERAIAEYEAAIAIDKKIQFFRGEAAAHDGLAGVYDHIGQYSKAVEEGQVAISLFDQLPAEERLKGHDLEGSAHLTLGSSYLNLGRLDEARAEYEKAEAELTDPSLRIAAANNLALVLRSLGRPQDALRAFQVTRDEAAKLGNLAQLGAAYKNIGDLESEAGDQVHANDDLTQALCFFRISGNKEGELLTLVSLGQIEFQQGHSGIAVFEFKLAVIELQRERNSVSSLGADAIGAFLRRYGPIYRELAAALLSQDMFLDAENVLDLLKDAEYMTYRSGSEEDYIDLSRAERVLADQYRGLDPNLSADAASLSELSDADKVRFNDQKIQPLFEANKKIFAAAEKDLENAPRRFTTLFDGFKTGVNTINQRLDEQPPHTAAAYSLMTTEGVWTAYTASNLTLHRLRRGDPRKLRTKLLEFLQQLRNRKSDFTDLAEELYDEIVRPIEPDLIQGGITRVMWSLDGDLRYIPLGALIDRSDHRFMFEKYPTILFTPSTRRSPAVKGPSAGFGVTQRAVVDNQTYEALPAVEYELEAFKTRMGAAIHKDSEFTKDLLKQTLVHGCDIVHLATHFRLNREPQKSALLLGDQSTLNFAYMQNSMYSSLHMNLLVLSACNTATPDDLYVDGEEYEGFARGAEEKGAGAVLATLWRVDDRATAIFMDKFYEILSQDPERSYLNALTQTQSWMRHADASTLATYKFESAKRDSDSSEAGGLADLPRDPTHPYAHPYYWAGFVLTGYSN